jgi:hypothetical protein
LTRLLGRSGHLLVGRLGVALHCGIRLGNVALAGRGSLIGLSLAGADVLAARRQCRSRLLVIDLLAGGPHRADPLPLATHAPLHGQGVAQANVLLGRRGADRAMDLQAGRRANHVGRPALDLVMLCHPRLQARVNLHRDVILGDGLHHPRLSKDRLLQAFARRAMIVIEVQQKQLMLLARQPLGFLEVGRPRNLLLTAHCERHRQSQDDRPPHNHGLAKLRRHIHYPNAKPG